MSIQFTPKSFEDETQKRSANINRENINANNSISGEEDESEKIVVGGTGSWEYEHKIRNDFQTVFDLIEKHVSWADYSSYHLDCGVHGVLCLKIYNTIYFL